MDMSLFLVARVSHEDIRQKGVGWLTSDSVPYQPEDDVTFIDTDEAKTVYQMYKGEYRKIDKNLLIKSRNGLMKYNRWVLIIGDQNEIAGFALCSTKASGLKLGLAASDRSEHGRAAVKAISRKGFNIKLVHGEVSDAMEKVVEGRVPEVDPKFAEVILQKKVKIDKDKRHYWRDIKNIGNKRKLLVGKPVLPPQGRP